jgi:ornithine cyclodeaminase
MPPRQAARVASREAILATMPAYLSGAGALGAKLVTQLPGNTKVGLHTHQAVIVAFDPETGTPLALMDGTYITAARTAAGSALATRYLARDDASVLAILGTGVQAGSHLRAMVRERQWDDIRIAGRDLGKAETLAAETSARLGRSIRAVGSFREALDGADVACATTHSPESVVRREWIRPGIHLTSVGFNPAGPEIDGAVVADALVVVENRQQALAPWPTGLVDLIRPLEAGLITAEHIHAELGELFTGARPGRTSAEQITLYKSAGVAVQDVAAAALVLEAGVAGGVGVEVEL